ncbi:hypothetical protein AXF42_Ash012368 [Apostasia shenzhenica]|uniref:Uncharacterized protein n=1 Tax=Apostasia shenzhenica TaxID=1088818 RepID=A0A2I0AD39_9ASPA|nr:hypothetical protein AXF42_Ash012368 [Apostasia shenzhenica]
MVIVYIRRRKKVKFYGRRRRGILDGKQPHSSGLEVQNFGLCSSVEDRDSGFLEGHRVAFESMSSEVKAESHARVSSDQSAIHIVVHNRRLPEDEPRVGVIPSGIVRVNEEPLLSALQKLTSSLRIQRRSRSASKHASSRGRSNIEEPRDEVISCGKIVDKPVLSVLQQLTSNLRIQRKPRSARKSSSLASRRWSNIKGYSSAYSKFKASQHDASAPVCSDTFPITSIEPSLNIIKIGMLSKINGLHESISLARTNTLHTDDKGNVQSIPSTNLKMELYGDRNRKCALGLVHELQHTIRFPKASRSARAKRQPFCVISEVNQEIPHQLNFRECDAKLYCAHKKQVIDMMSSKELLFSVESRTVCKGLFNSRKDKCSQKVDGFEGKNQLKEMLHSNCFSTKSDRVKLDTSCESIPSVSRNIVNVEIAKQAKKHVNHRDLDSHQKAFDFLANGSILSYRSCGEEVLKGYKHGKGILCSCCNILVSPSQFQAHAGHERRRKPYHNIYTAFGNSLHELALSLLHEKILHDPNKNHNITVEQCPSSSSGPFSLYPGRRFQAPSSFGSCILCRDGDATLNIFGVCDSSMLFCGQCGRMFHVGCLRHHGICRIETRPCPPDSWLCGNKCKKTRADLLDFVNRGPMTISKSILSSLRSRSAGRTSPDQTEATVHWQLLSGRFQGDQNESLLHQATAIFKETFHAAYKGRRDVLSVMVNGEKGIAEFFGGMFCAVLTVKSVIVSAALLRVFGHFVAEIPLAVTHKERQQGYFKVLFSKIEEMLSFMEVENLILPADDQTLPMWIDKFGFKILEWNQVLDYRRLHRIVVFEKTTTLQKAVPLSKEMVSS